MKITDFKVIYICPDHNEKYHQRKLHTEKLLKDLGFQQIIHYKSGNQTYPLCLALAQAEVLRLHLDEIFLLVEDDINYTGESLKLPDQLILNPEDQTISQINLSKNQVGQECVQFIDAIYLGISKSAGHPSLNIDYDAFQVKKWHRQCNTKFCRVLNMLSTHAILYISKTYKQKVLSLLEDVIAKNLVLQTDVLISRIQKGYIILAHRYPIFYQSSKLGNNPNVKKHTKFTITDGYLR